MLHVFLLIYLVKSDSPSVSLPNSLIQSNFSPQFISAGQIRLIGFDSKDNSKKLKSDLLILLNSRFIKIDIIDNDPNIHHLFKARVEILNFTYRNENELEDLISLHFKDHPSHFAIYVIKSKIPFNYYTTNSNIFSKGTNWLAIKFHNQDPKLDPAYQIAVNVLDILSSVFNNPLEVPPRVSIIFPHNSINVFQAQKYDSETVIRSSVLNLCTLNISVNYIDPSILNVLCTSCHNAKCASSLLKRLPEYLLSIDEGKLPLFILPSKCPYQYASSDLAFSPIGMDSLLKSIVRKSLFGFETTPQAEPFFDIMAQRNMAVYPLKHLMDVISQPVEEINDILLSIGNNENGRRLSRIQREIDILSEHYANYTILQKELASDILDVPIDSSGQEFDQNHNHTALSGIRETVAAASEHYQQLQMKASLITEEWLTASEEIVRKRQCVGNLRDLASNRSVFIRPSFYFTIALIASIFLLRYSSKHISKNILETLFPDPGLP